MEIIVKRFWGPSPPKPQQSSSESSSTNAPWAPMQPYIKKGYEMAANAYAQGPAQYTPWSQVANLNSDQMAHINGVNNYVNSANTQQMLGNQQGVVQDLMSGANNPYDSVTGQTNPMLAGYLSNNNLNDPSAGINHFLYQNTMDPGLQQSISGATGQADAAFGGLNGLVQNKFGMGQNLGSNTANINRSNATNQAFGQAFDNQNANRLQAINLANGINNNRASMAGDLLSQSGQYLNNSQNLGYSQFTNALNLPLSMLQQLNQVGGIQQDQDQAMLNDATNRWNFNQQAPMDALAKYNALINPDKSWGNTTTRDGDSSQQPGVSNLALGVGAGTSLAGLYAGSNTKR